MCPCGSTGGDERRCGKLWDEEGIRGGESEVGDPERQVYRSLDVERLDEVKGEEAMIK
jgi:hypothetical protein